jgi:preprotein translocase subunit SecB
VLDPIDFGAIYVQQLQAQQQGGEMPVEGEA